MNLKIGGLTALLSISVALGGAASITPASAHTLGKNRHPYGCDRKHAPKKCHKGSGNVNTTGGSNGNGAGSGSGAKGAKGPKGSKPVLGQGSPSTGYGGTAQDRGSSPRAGAAGSQAVVTGLASNSSSQHIVALPATGGGVPSQPQSPVLAFLACGLAALGLGLRKVAQRI